MRSRASLEHRRPLQSDVGDGTRVQYDHLVTDQLPPPRTDVSTHLPTGDPDLVRRSPGDHATLLGGEMGQPPVSLVMQSVTLHGVKVNPGTAPYNHPQAICGNPVP